MHILQTPGYHASVPVIPADFALATRLVPWFLDSKLLAATTAATEAESFKNVRLVIFDFFALSSISIISFST
jgi:hypothetical protein